MSIYLTFFILVSYLVWIKCIYCRHRRTFVNSLKRAINVFSSRETNNSEIKALIVTAHPDDECMFFAPTIIRLSQLNVSVHLLCLSEGNYYNQGADRKRELLNSCAVLGIPTSRVTIVDHKYVQMYILDLTPSPFIVAENVNVQTKKMMPAFINSQSIFDTYNTKHLPDNPKAEWSVSLVSAVIVKHMRAHSFNMVLTFDGRGVSGHANHIAIHRAVSHLACTGQIPNDCCLLSLVTVGLLRKYFSFLELPISWLLPSHLCCITGSQGYSQAKAAMLCHRTQLLWFRYLYIIFSRYMFINTFELIPQGPKNLKIY